MKGKWGSDIGLSVRMLLTMVLLGIVYVAFIGIILLYVRNIAVIAVFVALFLGAQYISQTALCSLRAARTSSVKTKPPSFTVRSNACAPWRTFRSRRSL